MAGYRPPEPYYKGAPPFSFLTVAVVCLAVEGIRYKLNPAYFNGFVSHPYLLSLGAAAITAALHAWIAPDSLPKSAVSAFFAQSSMPTIALVIWTATQEFGLLIREALRGITKVG